ncbi:MAG TPA: FAD-binding protein, partial [Actinotalea sp.]|nr:FAD-binding protein [Actinotalea sp.]
MTHAALADDDIEELRRQVSGPVVPAGDGDYDVARALWNGMIDPRPAVIVRAGHVHDVTPTVAFARRLGLDLAIRGGGHNVAGNGSVDGGVVLDLGDLHDVVVDPEARTVRVAAGAPLAAVDAAPA